MDGVDIVRLRHLAITGFTTLAGTRVYRLLLDQGATLPAARVTQVAMTESLHLRGRSGLRVERVQCDYYADTLAAAVALADAAYGDFSAGAPTGLAGWSGSIGSPATQVDLIDPATRHEFYEDEEDGTAIVTQDYYVHYRT